MLRVDLTKKRFFVEEIRDEDLKGFIGGKGLGIKILLEKLGKNVSPLSPENLLVFAVGPVEGLTFPGGAKAGVFFKSPLTGVFGESYCGGTFGPQLKLAGYDVLIVTGVSDKPTYLKIFDGEVEFKDASHLWGRDAYETEDIIKRDEDRRIQVACIGPAGENLVRFACINNVKGRQFGRCGAGAVMGSKRLKAIAILGTGKIEPENFEEYNRIREYLLEKSKTILKSLTEYGTAPMITLMSKAGALPTRYWREGEFEEVEKISAETMKKNVVKGNRACYGCPIACGKFSRVESGPFAGVEVEGPEFETLYSFGSLCGVGNLEAIVKANEVCDRLGMDTISAGNVVAFAIECFERGILGEEAVGGLRLSFGDWETILKLLPKIAYREGFGDVLADGVREVAKRIGGEAEKLAVHVKGLEPPAYDPRGIKAKALAYAISSRGACHLRHFVHRPNLVGKHAFKKDVAVDRFSHEEQVEMIVELEDFYTLVDTMILCRFVCLPVIGPLLWDEVTRLYNALTGLNVKTEDLVKTAVKINQMVRVFNVREGVTRKDDYPPERFYREPLKKGVADGHVVEKERFEGMLNKYYRIRGWDRDGKPSLKV
ncbi:MAG: aldehyde:ferredoxin oxidoreductase [Candidatus Hecatellales archaeon]|nr:MAG: aldehyde:ferredoxin oxidoreductase [Candidatus Hecatellales archaeon]